MRVLDHAYQKARRELIPLAVHFDLTYRCHQRCVHCYLPESWRLGEKFGQELHSGHVKMILDELAAAGTFFIAFSGGEIFLRPDLLDLLEYARRLNFSISLMTSGTFGLGKEKLHFLKDLGVNGLLMTLFSMDADIHDRVTGITGSWEILRRTIKTGKTLGLPVVLNCIALSLNHSGIGAVQQYAEGEGIPLRLDPRLSPRWDSRPHTQGLSLTTEEQSKLRNEIIRHQRTGKKESITVPWEADLPGCGAGENRCYLTPQGELWPCLEMPWPAGRLSDKGDFGSLWETSPAFKEVRMLQMTLLGDGPRLCDMRKQQHCKPEKNSKRREGNGGPK
jgi:AdoMet-dependent heme synthase